MATLSLGFSTGALSWREMHHLALATHDLEATVRFYTDVLGMQAGEIAPANPIHGRTCTIKPSVDAVGELHFFEQPEAQPLPARPEMLQQLIFPTVGVHHIAFMLPNAAEGLKVQERLHALSIEMTPVMDQGDIYNFLFLDNNNLLLEANWPKE